MPKVLYTLHGIPWVECEENSLLDQVITNVLSIESIRENKRIAHLLTQGLKGIEKYKKRESRDILEHSTRSV